jgi:hypothetical protein
MKKLWIIVVLVIVIGLLFLSRTKNPSPESPARQNTAASENTSNLPVGLARTQAVPPVVANSPAPNISASADLAWRAASPNPSPGWTPDTNEPPPLPPLVVLDKARVLIHNYHTAFGENPVGNNPEIAAALQGKNPKQINFLGDSGLRLNGKGEIVDGYGTPFFFHQISGNEMEIRSAGPDKVMWTADDLVTK